LGYAALSLVSPPALLSSAESAASSVTLRQLDGLPLVLPTNNHGLRRTLELSASQANLKLNVQYEVDTLSLMKEIVLAGLAHTVLAIPAVQSEVENGRLIARRLYEPTVETRLVLAKCSNRPLNRAIRLVEQEIKHTFHQVLQKASLDLDLSVASQSIFSPTGSLTAHP
jgi:LysR family nitrogen assimilation transcriptional regulator